MCGALHIIIIIIIIIISSSFLSAPKRDYTNMKDYPEVYTFTIAFYLTKVSICPNVINSAYENTFQSLLGCCS